MIPKYRIYDKEYNKYCEEPDHRWMLSRNGRLYNSENDKFHIIGERFLVEFYTGLEDINRIEIFDKDIVKDHAIKQIGVVHFGSPYNNGWEIRYFEDFNGNPINIENDSDFAWASLTWSSRKDYEVIGNIHENKNLL